MIIYITHALVHYFVDIVYTCLTLSKNRRIAAFEKQMFRGIYALF